MRVQDEEFKTMIYDLMNGHYDLDKFDCEESSVVRRMNLKKACCVCSFSRYGIPQLNLKCRHYACVLKMRTNTMMYTLIWARISEIAVLVLNAIVDAFPHRLYSAGMGKDLLIKSIPVQLRRVSIDVLQPSEKSLRFPLAYLIASLQVVEVSDVLR